MLYTCVKCLRYVGLGVAALALCASAKDRRWLAVVLAMIPLFYLLIMLEKRLKQRQNAKLPIAYVEAKLIRRRQECEGRMAVPRRWFLTFCLEADGSELEFEVSREEFDRIQVGAEGPLAYRGRQYLSFRRTVNNAGSR